MPRLRHLLPGSIGGQITALAVAPTLVVCLIGYLTEPAAQDEGEIPYASATALRIRLVVGQVSAAETPGQAAAVLAATTRTGLRVEALSAADAAGGAGDGAAPDDLLRQVREELPRSLGAELRDRTSPGGVRHQVVTVRLGDGSALAFAPGPEPPGPLISDRDVNIALAVAVVVVPVLLLSFYAGRMITAPLTRFAAAAQALSPDEGPDRPFGEGGAREVGTLARALNDMRTRVREMIEDRTRMVRAISHDLRTPLTRLRMRAERSAQGELREAMLNDIVRIDALIGETLTYLQKDVSAERLLRADLPSLLQTVCSDFADMGCAVSYDGPDRLAYDCKPQALSRALTNLVDNGAKFAGAVTVRLTPLDGGRVRIDVADDGPGVPAELRAKVLQPFFKADASRSPTGGRGGFGLGLSIVRDIVRGHAGSMALLDGDPRGLTVRIELPARRRLRFVRVSAPPHGSPRATDAPRRRPPRPFRFAALTRGQ